MTPELCIRWGSGADRCIRGYDHTGLCRNSDGETIYTLAQWQETDRADALETIEAYEREHEFREDAEGYICAAAEADTHSSDVDPGRVDPWSER